MPNLSLAPHDKSGEILDKNSSCIFPDKVFLISCVQVLETSIYEMQRVKKLMVLPSQVLLESGLDGVEDDGVGDLCECVFDNLSLVNLRRLLYHLRFLLLSLLLLLLLVLFFLFVILFLTSGKSRIFGECFLVHIKNFLHFLHIFDNLVVLGDHLLLFFVELDFPCEGLLLGLLDLLQLLVLVSELLVEHVHERVRRIHVELYELRLPTLLSLL
mmetsp:Transcript_14673/g.10558  ORF Transcript_14673/g.10558 Transcript_14673/m.10558 type:complete len:214 (-) Transcript_14673:9-650(-)